MRKNVVTGIFKSRFAAEAVVEALTRQGYTEDDISVLMSDQTRTKEFALATGTRAVEGAGVGAGIGGVIGAIVAAIAAAGSTIVAPGVGLVVAGPVAGALAGAGAGGAAGGIVGALVGAGLPEHRAKIYDSHLRAGGILIGVEARSREDRARIHELLSALGGEHVKSE